MSVRYFSEDDIETLKMMFDAYYTVKDIARVLKRSEIAIGQKIMRLGLKRDVRLVAMVVHFGPEILQLGSDYETVRKTYRQQRIADKNFTQKLAAETQEIAITDLKHNLAAGMDRNEAIKAAYTLGAKQAEIGRVVGMTKAGISWIVNPRVPKKYDPFRR